MVPKPTPSFLKLYHDILALLVLQSTFNRHQTFILVRFSHAHHIFQEPQGKLLLPFYLSPALKYSVVIYTPSFIDLFFSFVSHLLLLGFFPPLWGAKLSGSFVLPAS